MGTANNSEAKKKVESAAITKREIESRYFSERFVPLFPALRVVGSEVNLSRSEILVLLSAKTIQRQQGISFTAKSIEAYSFVAYKNLNAVLIKLAEKGFLKIEECGKRFSDSPTRYALSYQGIKAIMRLDDLVMDFNHKLSVHAQ